MRQRFIGRSIYHMLERPREDSGCLMLLAPGLGWALAVATALAVTACQSAPTRSEQLTSLVVAHADLQAVAKESDAEKSSNVRRTESPEVTTSPTSLDFFRPGWRPDSPLGIGGYSFSHNFQRPEAALRESREALSLHNLSGASWARQDFWWSIVNPRPGVWEWDLFDRAVDAYNEHGIRLLAILCYGSPWASNHDAPVTPEAWEAFGEYVYQMVSRYKGRVGAWEVWNEPDILPFWAPDPNPDHYAELLKVTYRRAKEADPNAVVVAGALAMGDTRFFEAVCARGAAHSFDVLSFHTYGQKPDEAVMARTAMNYRAVMNRYGVDKPVWLTETGVYTGPAGVNEREQAAAIARVSLGAVGSGEIDKVFQLTLRDWTDDPNTVDGTSFRGLLRADAKPKESFEVHRRLAHALAGRRGLGWVFPQPGVRGAALGQPERPLLALWREEPEESGTEPGDSPVTVSLVLDTRQIVVTLLESGATRSLRSPEGRFEIPVTRFPLLVEGAGMGVGAAALLRFEPSPLIAGSEGSSTMTLKRRPIEGLEEDWTVTLEEGPTGCAIEPREVRLGNDGRPVALALKADGAPSRGFLRANVTGVHNTLPWSGRVGTSIQFRPVAEAAWEKPTWLDPANPAWMLALSHRKAEPLEIALQLGAAFGDAASLPANLDMQSMRVLAGQRAWIRQPLPLKAGEARGQTLWLRAQAAAGGAEAAFDTPELRRPIVSIPRTAAPFQIDGKLDDWKDFGPPLLDHGAFTTVFFNPSLAVGDEDLSAQAWMAWSDTDLYLAVRVRDNVTELANTPTVWDFDSLQLAFDFGNDTPEKSGFDSLNDSELQIARMSNGRLHFAPSPFPPGRPVEPLLQGALIVVEPDPQGPGLIYEMALPWAALPMPHPPRAGTLFAFNFILNDNDGAGRKGWLEFQPGIGWGKDPSLYALGWLN